MTAKRLVLIRHAKAKQGDRDIERPLARRGRDDAKAVGEWLAAHAAPDLAIVSPSLRTRQTWDCAAGSLATRAQLRIDDKVYDNTVADLVDAVRACDESLTTVALVGHNPSIQTLAARAARATDEGMEALLSYPTSTVALVEVDTAWQAFDPAQARLVAVEICRGDPG